MDFTSSKIDFRHIFLILDRKRMITMTDCRLHMLLWLQLFAFVTSTATNSDVCALAVTAAQETRWLAAGALFEGCARHADLSRSDGGLWWNAGVAYLKGENVSSAVRSMTFALARDPFNSKS